MYYVVRKQNRTVPGATLMPIAISAVEMTLVEGCVWFLAGYSAGETGVRDVGVSSRYLDLTGRFEDKDSKYSYVTFVKIH